ncbi:MAG: antitoxin [Blastomonas sp. CACIA14H2]|jgi:prevent-host-death family protein|uniref:type II toxin-antitoxin system Phd/YefM family antitoxin n=1 Tax=unclassified Blastomonas TaxID=2626550 RepID=UPI0003D0653F|nr:type II toxin-antitoxin system Phd/YefM family antitoxin [Blastomonas sp. UPD001]ESZ87398.1 MAG: antitoxin [Blastomonas sp. CACIA14H2]MBL0966064.1 type II toxin-antitoxin system Phd/YefM family antitoxin [Blastomonas sp.]
MTSIVNVHDAKTHFSKLLDRAHAGEEIILAKAGKPYARLVPLEQVKVERRPGRLKLSQPIPDSFFFDPLPEEELRAWE